MPHQHFAGAEGMPVRAAGGRLGYPLAFGRSDELALRHSRLERFSDALARITGDKSTENEGKAEQAKANLKDAGEKVKDAFTNYVPRHRGEAGEAQAVRVTAQAVRVTAPGMGCNHGEGGRARYRGYKGGPCVQNCVLVGVAASVLVPLFGGFACVVADTHRQHSDVLNPAGEVPNGLRLRPPGSIPAK